MEDLIPMVISVSLFFSIAAVLIFRPLSKRLGDVIGVLAQSRSAAAATAAPKADDGETVRLRATVEHLTARLELMEERLDFTERLLAASGRVAGPAAPLLRERAGA
ncbi:MAG TPA: hypothetical protein VFQ38_16265 [Longimicrobiales bacterium]|nr:hypothetical protein [Longimicrobiales bacterium]